jgi:hypothetical protein
MSPTLKPMPGLRAAVLLALIAITACASLATRSQMDAFDQISKQYRHALLASDFEAAASMTASPGAADLALLKHIHVISYTLKKVGFSKDGSKVSQEVDLEYYRTDSMRQKRLRDQQQWLYQADAKRWVLTSGLPDFK